MRLAVCEGYIKLIEDFKTSDGKWTSRGVIGLGRYTEKRMVLAKQLLEDLKQGRAEIRKDAFGHKYVLWEQCARSDEDEK